MRTIQPYFVIATSQYHKEIMMRYGIAHFYQYCHNTTDLPQVLAVSDGCVDILFEKDSDGIRGRAAGTVLKSGAIDNAVDRDFFGVRFLPGVMPAVLNISPADLIGHEFDLPDILYDRSLLPDIEAAYAYGNWIDVFMQHYMKALRLKEERERKITADVCSYLADEIMLANGTAAIASLTQKTGYSERYVNELFRTSVGLSPKTFSQIMQFQNALQLINRQAANLKLTDIGILCGYYDQSHFIRSFKKYAHYTPHEYRRLIRDCHYQSRIVESSYRPSGTP